MRVDGKTIKTEEARNPQKGGPHKEKDGWGINPTIAFYGTFWKVFLGALHIGHIQLSGRSINFVPGLIPLLGSPLLSS
jgi:hypothetical protein